MSYRIIWVGKTTIGKLLYEKIMSKNSAVFLDGDQLREIYRDGLSYIYRSLIK